MKRAVLLSLFLLVLPATLALAADPPGRVARLDYMNGAVSIQPEGTGEWAAGSVNQPLTNADNVWTDKDARAELSVGLGVLRMGPESSLTITNVSDSAVQVELHQGTLNLRVRHLFDGETYEVNTANLSFTLQKSGEYRFDVDPNGDTTTVTVWKGEGDATGGGPAVRLRSHEQARFSGIALAHDTNAAPASDGFDDWCRVRDQREDHSLSARYVAPGVIGYEDLDGYGQWEVIPPYGAVWVPAVPAGWAPYRFGHWVWVGPWGWTWIDDAPWGFAPFHYGRWISYNGFWGWAPGPIYARPCYAPALVAWFGGPGFGAGFSFGIGGGVAWVPLGFGEPFFPYYGVSVGYFRSINLSGTRIVNINGISNNYFRNPGGVLPVHYVNARFAGGVTAVSRDTFVHARPIGNAFVHVPANALAGAHAQSRVPFEATRESRLGPGAGRSAAAPPARAFERQALSRSGSPAGSSRGQSNIADLRRPAGRAMLHGSTGNAGLHSNAGVADSRHYVPRPGGNSAVAVKAKPSAAQNSTSAQLSRSVPRPTGAVSPAAGHGNTTGLSGTRSSGWGSSGTGHSGSSSPHGAAAPSGTTPHGGSGETPHSGAPRSYAPANRDGGARAASRSFHSPVGRRG
jgi:hypothetical protein